MAVRHFLHSTVDRLHAMNEPLVCSAKRCQETAVWALLWNNPRLHTPERRKSWLACGEHRQQLASFLGARGFLRDVVPVAEAPVDPGRPG